MTGRVGARTGRQTWNPANAVTLLRVALVPVVAALLALSPPSSPARWWAFAVFVLAAASDSVDGYVARRWDGATRWGQMADPVADKVLVIGTLSVLVWQEALPSWGWAALTLIVAREVAVTVQRGRLSRRGIVMPASVYGKVKTVTQLVAVALALLPPAPQGLVAVALALAVAATMASGVEYVYRGRRLRRAR